MSTYRVGVVGLSWITADPPRAGVHPVLGTAPPHSHLSALAATPAVTVVAGCDTVPEARERFLATWCGTWPDAQVYADHQAMLSAHELDVVCVATPDHLHGAIVCDIAVSGARGIFCEKPISHHLADVDAMIETIEAHGVRVNVNNTRRWMPQYVAAREAIRAGEIGPLSQVTIHFGGERAMLWRNHAHFLDLCSYFADDDPVWVTAELEPGFEAYGTQYRGDGGRSPALEPGVNAYIAYRNGVRAFLGGMKSGMPRATVDLIGSEASIRVDDQGAVLIRGAGSEVTTRSLTTPGTVMGIQAAILDLLTALETGQDVQCPPREARKTVALIEAILASQAAGNIRIQVDGGASSRLADLATAMP